MDPRQIGRLRLSVAGLLFCVLVVLLNPQLTDQRDTPGSLLVVTLVAVAFLLSLVSAALP
jgi:hypothetical protein